MPNICTAAHTATSESRCRTAPLLAIDCRNFGLLDHPALQLIAEIRLEALGLSGADVLLIHVTVFYSCPRLSGSIYIPKSKLNAGHLHGFRLFLFVPRPKVILALRVVESLYSTRGENCNCGQALGEVFVVVLKWKSQLKSTLAESQFLGDLLYRTSVAAADRSWPVGGANSRSSRL